MNVESGFCFKVDDNNNNIATTQEANIPLLVEISTNKHDEGFNQSSSMDIEIRNIS